MNARAPEPRRRRAGRADSLLGLAVLLGGLLLGVPQGCGGSAWPGFAADPIFPEATPEIASVAAMRAQDSLLVVLAGTLAAEDLPSPPGEADARLVSWIRLLLCFPPSGAIESFARYAPSEWAAADPDGDLPLAAALALHEQGRGDRALEWLASGRPNDEETRPRALLTLEIHDALGDSAGALAIAESIRASYPRAEWTMPAARRVLAAREHAKDSEGLLRESLAMRRTLGPGADETAARVRALLALGRPAAARATADTLLRRYPGTRTARLEALRRFREAPALAARREGTLLFPVFLEHRLFGTADSLLSRMPSSPDSLRVAWLEALLKGRQYEAILSDPMRPDAGWPEALRARWLLVRARAARNSGEWDAMERAYRAAARLGGETRRTALVEWGREAESARRDARADSVYTALLALPGSEVEGRLRRAIARYAAGDEAAALGDFRAAAAAVGATAGDVAAARFWCYRLESRRGDLDAAKASLAAAATSGEGYYAHRARAEQDLLARSLPPDRFWPLEREAALRPARVAEAALLDPGSPSAGSPAGPCDRLDREAARRAARLRLLRRFGRADWTSPDQERLESALPVGGRAEAFLCLGLPDLAVRVAVARGAAAPVSLRYPRPFPSWIEQRCREVSVSPDLVWAIARRESLFDPGAVSGAGARGLLQMMAPTAQETASKWGIEAGPLERADRNLALGIRHFRDLADGQDWPLPALLAAYNAGSAKASEWVERFGDDPDLLIERIGWRETREYVRHVLDAVWTYRNAYGRSGGEQGGGTAEPQG